MNERPFEIPPAIAGALLDQAADRRLALATLLDWDRRGLLDIRAAGDAGFSLRLSKSDPKLTGFEASLWRRLAAEADAGGGLTNVEVRSVLRGWDSLAAELHDDLARRGWTAPDAVERRRSWGRWAAAALVAGVVVGVVALVALPWAGLPAALLLLTAFGLWIAARVISPLTPAGQTTARRLHEYRQELRRLARDANGPFDSGWSLPHLVAFGDDNLLPPESESARDAEPLTAADRLFPAHTFAAWAVLTSAIWVPEAGGANAGWGGADVAGGDGGGGSGGSDGSGF